MSDEIAARLQILGELADRLEARRQALAAAGAEDIGLPHFCAHLEVDLAVEHLQTMAVEVPYVAGKTPYGVVADILPYDASPVVLAWVGGAAVLGGNRFRFSCSSQTPRIARILAEAVAPLSCFEAVTGLDNRRFGEQCIKDPAVRVLLISGGSTVGDTYARSASSFDKLFFGGPSGLPPMIFFRDTPLETAVPILVRRAFLNGGQYCTTIKRVYIHPDLYEQAREMILERTAAIKVGDPLDPDTWIGPIKVERTRKLIDRALEALKDAPFLVPPRREGEWQGPFLVETDEPPDLELFGPFLALVRTESDEAAVAAVLRSRYPFSVSFFGTPPPGAREALAAKFGMVFASPEFLFVPLRLPFGGKGESGWIMERHHGRLVKRDGTFIYSAELVRG
jgi:acyl-CoA reductase-like NAD-dependent aldehyde dehydrogenase